MRLHAQTIQRHLCRRCHWTNGELKIGIARWNAIIGPVKNEIVTIWQGRNDGGDWRGVGMRRFTRQIAQLRVDIVIYLDLFGQGSRG